MKRISKIEIIRSLDVFGDLEHVGKFSNEPGPFAVDHHKIQGYAERNTYQYFNPAEGTVENKKQARQAYDYVMRFERGELSLVNIEVVAHIETSTDGRCWLHNEVSGGSMGDLVSNDESEQQAAAADLLGELETALENLGFSKEEIEQAKPANLTPIEE